MLKSTGRHAFGEFVLDREQRTLTRAGEPVELNARYFDALALMVESPGRLITKDRFMDEVWRGVPVTDEALTQCIRSLRKALGDDAARPRFIETVPKHGYRFKGEVIAQGEATIARGRLGTFALLAGAGTIGGGLAGLVGGAIYGLAAASNAAAQEVGGVSILLVLMCVTIAVALIGAAGVSCGIAAALARRRRTALELVAGGAVGGLLVGLIAKLIMTDAFRILFGHSPGEITGAVEGLILGAAVGLGAWAAARTSSLRKGAALAAACGAAGGLIVAMLGRPLMAGSLARLAERLPASRLSLDPVGALIGEDRFGPIASAVTATLEGALFAGAIVLAMRLMERQETA